VGTPWVSLLLFFVIPAQAGIHPDPCLFLASAELPLALRASGLLLALPKSRQKARRLTRCPAARHARRGVPALLAFAGSLRRHIPCAASRSRQSLAATLRAFSREGCDARHRERRRDPRIRASLHYLEVPEWKALALASASAAGCRPLGPPEAWRGCAGKVRRRAHTMCARSLNVHGRTSSEPRSALAKAQGRMPGDRAAGGVFLWLPFFAQAKKVTRSAAGRVEALLSTNRKTRKMDSACAGMMSKRTKRKSAPAFS
jgi:hypothetical protein